MLGQSVIVIVDMIYCYVGQDQVTGLVLVLRRIFFAQLAVIVYLIIMWIM